jgi:hypothetical protein
VLYPREVCTEIADFVEEVGPSSTGGAKVPRAIHDIVLDRDVTMRRAGHAARYRNCLSVKTFVGCGWSRSSLRSMNVV